MSSIASFGNVVCWGSGEMNCNLLLYNLYKIRKAVLRSQLTMHNLKWEVGGVFKLFSTSRNRED